MVTYNNLHPDSRADFVARRLRPALLMHLRGRYRALAPDHEDLVQQTLSDVHRYFTNHRTWPDEEADIDRLAFTILRRRVVDKVRSDFSNLESGSSDDLQDVVSDAPAVDAIVRFRRLLHLVMQELEGLGEADRHSLLDETLGRSEDSAKTPNERQRLSRARARLRAAVEARIGASVKDYLGD